MNYEKFREYVFAQPSDRPINHEATWCGCAVGDAYYHYYPEREPDNKDYGILFPNADEILDAHLTDEHNLLFEALNESGQPQCRWPGPSRLDTYGALQDFINWLRI